MSRKPMRPMDWVIAGAFLIVLFSCALFPQFISREWASIIVVLFVAGVGFYKSKPGERPNFILGFGLVLVFLGSFDVIPSIPSLLWKSTEGTIISSEIFSIHGKGGPGYGVKVEYRYEVGGVSYLGNQMKAGIYVALSDPSIAMGEKRRFFVGANVPVYFDQKDPAKSALRREPGIFFAGPFFLGALLILLGFILDGFGIRSWMMYLLRVWR